MADFVVVVNLGEINRKLAASGPLVYKAMKAGLVEAAEPIRLDATGLAESQISGMRRSKKKPPPWSIQRIGQTIHEVYVAPRERGVKSKTDRSRRRPNFATLMLERSYDPALERGTPGVLIAVDNWLGRVIGEI